MREGFYLTCKNQGTRGWGRKKKKKKKEEEEEKKSQQKSQKTLTLTQPKSKNVRLSQPKELLPLSDAKTRVFERDESMRLGEYHIRREKKQKICLLSSGTMSDTTRTPDMTPRPMPTTKTSCPRVVASLLFVVVTREQAGGQREEEKRTEEKRPFLALKSGRGRRTMRSSRPGRVIAGSSCSGWEVVPTMITCVSSEPEAERCPNTPSISVSSSAVSRPTELSPDDEAPDEDDCSESLLEA